MAYDKKYRTRVVEYIQEGHTQEEASKVFCVGTTSIKRWLSAYEATGTTGGGYSVGKRGAKKIEAEKLEAYMIEHPDAFLKEIAQVFVCSSEAVRKALIRGKYTHKKNECV